jgi:hypothetical protein
VAAEVPDEQVSTSDLLARSRYMDACLQLYLNPNERTPLDKVLLFVLQEQGADGAWAAHDYPQWTEILTALTIQSLLQLGFDQDATWPIDQFGQPPRLGGIPQALEYLHRSRTARGWGEDIYDTCQVLKAFMTLRNRRRVADDIRWGLTYLDAQINSDFDEYRGSNWYGPGFYSAALDVLALQGRRQLASAQLLEKLANMQNPVCGFFGAENSSVDLKIFHTANSVTTLRAQSLSPSAASVERAVLWLESVQNSDAGNWGTGTVNRMDTIFTGYAVMALRECHGGHSAPAERGLQWLQGHQAPGGRIEGIEGTVMSLQCLTKVDPTLTSPTLPMGHVIELSSLLREYDQVTTALRGTAADVAYQLERAQLELAAEGDKYIFRLSTRRAAQIGLMIGILGLIVGFLVPLLTL